MNENELLKMITDVWQNVDMDHFYLYLVDKGMSDAEINKYIEKLNEIMLNQI